MQSWAIPLDGLFKGSDSLGLGLSIQALLGLSGLEGFVFLGEFIHFFVGVVPEILHCWAGKVLWGMVNFMNFKLFNSLAAKIEISYFSNPLENGGHKQHNPIHVLGLFAQIPGGFPMENVSHTHDIFTHKWCFQLLYKFFCFKFFCPFGKLHKLCPMEHSLYLGALCDLGNIHSPNSAGIGEIQTHPALGWLWCFYLQWNPRWDLELRCPWGLWNGAF